MGDWQTLHRWTQFLRAQGLADKTIRLYTYGVFRLHIETGRTTEDLTEDDVVAFLASLGKHSSARRQYLHGIRSYLRYCNRRGVVGYDASEAIRPKRSPRRPTVVLEEEELFRLLMAAYHKDPRRAWTLMLSFGLGTRRMELAGIDPSRDLHPDGRVELRNTKGGKPRVVEIGPVAAVALENLKPWWNGTVLGGVRPQTVTHWANEAAKDAGLYDKVRGRVSHVLRASFATHMLRKGVPVTVVRDLLGHESIATTNVYAAAATPEERRSAVGSVSLATGAQA